MAETYTKEGEKLKVEKVVTEVAEYTYNDLLSGKQKLEKFILTIQNQTNSKLAAAQEMLAQIDKLITEAGKLGMENETEKNK